MLTIPTYVTHSPIDGLGVFTCTNVKKGEVVWRFNPIFDILLTPDQVNHLDSVSQEYVWHYGYLDKQQFKGFYVLHAGNDKYCNHSSTPTTIPVIEEDGSYSMQASHDLDLGTELTCDYNEYETRCRHA